MHLWDLCETADIMKDWDAEIWQLSQTDVVVDTFEPGVYVLERPAAAILGKAWRTNPPRKLPVHAPIADVPPPPTCVPLQDWRLDGPDEVFGPNAFGEALDKASRIVQNLRRSRAKRRAQRPRGGAGGASGWDAAPSNSGSSESSSSSGESGDGGGGGGGGGDIPPPIGPGDGVPPPPVAPPDAVPRAPPVPRRLVEAKEWLVCEVPGARFILDPYSLSVGCHCTLHGTQCGVNKVVTKQPVGYFLAWLQAAHLFTDAADHKAAKTIIGGDRPIVSYDQRVAGRKRAEDDPLYAKLLDWEVPKRGLEPKVLK